MCNCNSNGYQAGWPGVAGIQVSTPMGNCGCNQPMFPPNAYNCATGCPIQLDSDCLIYHKNGNIPSGLTNLGLGNGSTAQLIFDTIDVKLSVLNVPLWAVPYLRTKYPPLLTLQQFGQAVDTEFASLDARVTTIEGSALLPLVGNDSSTIDFTLSGTLNRIITADVKISTTANNNLTIVGTGLYATPQTLSINYTTKELTITNGNTVDFSSLVCGASGFLGNVIADPTAIDGQYWFRTDLPAASGLRMKLNGAVRTITTS